MRALLAQLVRVFYFFLGNEKPSQAGTWKGGKEVKKMRGIHQIKVLNDEDTVNEYLKNGWKILKIFAADCYILGFPDSDV